MQGPYDAIVEGPGPSHVPHILLTLLFMGFWIPIWLLVVATHKRAVYRIGIDVDGGLAIYEATRGTICTLSPEGALGYAR